MVVRTYFQEIAAIAGNLDAVIVGSMIERLVNLKNKQGRLFVLGVGGSSANASHAVNDFRKACGIQALAPAGNAAELTAWTNDESWEMPFAGWLQATNPNPRDVMLVLSAGGGTYKTSLNIRKLVEFAGQKHIDVLGIVGPSGGCIAARGNIVLKIPCGHAQYVKGNSSMPVEQEIHYITALTELVQSVVLHAIVFDARLRRK